MGCFTATSKTAAALCPRTTQFFWLNRLFVPFFHVLFGFLMIVTKFYEHFYAPLQLLKNYVA